MLKPLKVVFMQVNPDMSIWQLFRTLPGENPEKEINITYSASSWQQGQWAAELSRIGHCGIIFEKFGGKEFRLYFIDPLDSLDYKPINYLILELPLQGGSI